MTPSTSDVSSGSAPETTTSAQPPAESSPAAQQEHSKFEVPRDPKAYAAWREKGVLPGEKAAKPKAAEESATSQESASEEEGEKDAPASESGSNKKQEQPLTQRRSAEHRLQEVLADLKRAGLSPAELKTYKREAAAATTQTQPAKPAEPEKTAQPSAAKPAEPPKLEDFATWDEYRKAERTYNDTLVAERVQAELAQHLIKQRAETALAEAKTRYGDEAESYIRSTATSIFNDAAIPPVLKAVLNESPVCADVLYVMGSNSQELSEFVELARTNPGQALRKVVLLEQLVQDELKKGAKPGAIANGNGAQAAEPERDEKGQFVKQQQAAPASRKPAPAPATEVSGRASAPPDRLAQAIEKNDFRAYREEANRRDMAARQGR